MIIRPIIYARKRGKEGDTSLSTRASAFLYRLLRPQRHEHALGERSRFAELRHLARVVVSNICPPMLAIRHSPSLRPVDDGSTRASSSSTRQTIHVDANFVTIPISSRYLSVDEKRLLSMETLGARIGGEELGRIARRHSRACKSYIRTRARASG